MYMRSLVVIDVVINVLERFFLNIIFELWNCIFYGKYNIVSLFYLR